MLANYGFEDGTGAYFIRIDTDKCLSCSTRDCISACPQGVYQTEEDDWGDETVTVNPQVTHQLKERCISCKKNQAAVPCITACKSQAIVHSW